MKKIISKENFAAIINEYPADLDYNENHICDPPMVTYNDFSDGKKWPESILCGFTANRDGTLEHFTFYEDEEQVFNLKDVELIKSLIYDDLNTLTLERRSNEFVQGVVAAKDIVGKHTPNIKAMEVLKFRVTKDSSVKLD